MLAPVLKFLVALIFYVPYAINSLMR